MKNIYRASFKLLLAIDSFVIFPTGDNDELLIYSHYVPEGLMKLRSGKYVFNEYKKQIPIEGEETVEKKPGIIFMPDLKNNFSDIRVKNKTCDSIDIECDIYLANKSEIIQLAFCESWMQQYISVAPIIEETRRISTISKDKIYYTGFKTGGDTTVFTPFKF